MFKVYDEKNQHVRTLYPHTRGGKEEVRVMTAERQPELDKDVKNPEQPRSDENTHPSLGAYVLLTTTGQVSKPKGRKEATVIRTRDSSVK